MRLSIWTAELPGKGTCGLCQKVIVSDNHCHLLLHQPYHECVFYWKLLAQKPTCTIRRLGIFFLQNFIQIKLTSGVFGDLKDIQGIGLMQVALKHSLCCFWQFIHVCSYKQVLVENMFTFIWTLFGFNMHASGHGVDSHMSWTLIEVWLFSCHIKSASISDLIGSQRVVFAISLDYQLLILIIAVLQISGLQNWVTWWIVLIGVHSVLGPMLIGVKNAWEHSVHALTDLKW